MFPQTSRNRLGLMPPLGFRGSLWPETVTTDDRATATFKGDVVSAFRMHDYGDLSHAQVQSNFDTTGGMRCVGGDEPPEQRCARAQREGEAPERERL